MMIYHIIDSKDIITVRTALNLWFLL